MDSLCRSPTLASAGYNYTLVLHSAVSPWKMTRWKKIILINWQRTVPIVSQELYVEWKHFYFGRPSIQHCFRLVSPLSGLLSASPLPFSPHSPLPQSYSRPLSSLFLSLILILVHLSSLSHSALCCRCLWSQARRWELRSGKHTIFDLGVFELQSHGKNLDAHAKLCAALI